MQEVGLKEAFQPLFSMDDAEPTTLTNIALRGSFALLAIGVAWVLYANSPDKGGWSVLADKIYQSTFVNIQLKRLMHTLNHTVRQSALYLFC